MGMDPEDKPVYESLTPLTSMGANNEEATEELELEIDTSEEGEPLQTAPSPILASAKVVEEHRHLHIPYRDWCKFWVMGRGTGVLHERSGSSLIPLVGLEYFYIRSGGVKVRSELEFAVTARATPP